MTPLADHSRSDGWRILFAKGVVHDIDRPACDLLHLLDDFVRGGFAVDHMRRPKGPDELKVMRGRCGDDRTEPRQFCELER